GHTASDVCAVLGGESLQSGDVPPVNRLRSAQTVCGVVEEVAAVHALGEHDQTRALTGRLLDEARHQLKVGIEVTEDREGLHNSGLERLGISHGNSFFDGAASGGSAVQADQCRIENLLADVDALLEHSFGDEHVDERLIGVKVGLVQVTERA